jgi:hypothetical protein
MTEHDEDGYTGPATLLIGEQELAVDIELRGYFQPIDGFFHWYGRVKQHDGLAELLKGKKTAALVRTPHGEAKGELSDPDPWNRYRVTGTSRPPFEIA